MLKSRIILEVDKQIEYKVKWKGFKADTWDQENHFKVEVLEL
jgi:hypothetical protein